MYTHFERLLVMDTVRSECERDMSMVSFQISETSIFHLKKIGFHIHLFSNNLVFPNVHDLSPRSYWLILASNWKFYWPRNN